jgi:hypothetical protein
MLYLKNTWYLTYVSVICAFLHIMLVVFGSDMYHVNVVVISTSVLITYSQVITWALCGCKWWKVGVYQVVCNTLVTLILGIVFVITGTHLDWATFGRMFLFFYPFLVVSLQFGFTFIVRLSKSDLWVLFES